MDLQMPVMDGLEATRKIRSGRQGDGVPIIAMTAAVLTQDREACLAVGMNDHIPKPLDLEQLLAALLRWIEPNVPNNHFNKATGALPAAGTDDFTVRYDREVVAGHLRTIRETVEKNRVVPHQIMAELGDLLGGSDVVSQMEMLRKQLDRFSYTEALASVTMIDRILQIDSGD
jgi:DNA-binding NarL/FixJ family response regulator